MFWQGLSKATPSWFLSFSEFLSVAAAQIRREMPLGATRRAAMQKQALIVAMLTLVVTSLWCTYDIFWDNGPTEVTVVIQIHQPTMGKTVQTFRKLRSHFCNGLGRIKLQRLRLPISQAVFER